MRSSRSKTYKKSSAFWKHGKHKGMLSISIEKNKESKKKNTEPMYDSPKELMEASRKNRKRNK